MVDLKRYVRLKSKGLVWIEKEGENIYVKFKRFSVEDGSEIIEEPEKQLIQLDLIEEERVKAEKLISDTNEFLNDLNEFLDKNK